MNGFINPLLRLCVVLFFAFTEQYTTINCTSCNHPLTYFSFQLSPIAMELPHAKQWRSRRTTAWAVACCCLINLPAMINANSCTVDTFGGTVRGSPFTGDNGPITSAKLSEMSGMWINTAISNDMKLTFAGYVRKIDFQSKIISIFAGGQVNPVPLGEAPGDGTKATSAGVGISPWSLTGDSVGNIFIADYSNSRVRKVTTNGIISTYAGLGNGANGPGQSTGTYVQSMGDGGQATSANLYQMRHMSFDSNANVYLLGANKVRKVSRVTGIITLYGGTGLYNAFAAPDAPATSTIIPEPFHSFIDTAGNLFISNFGYPFVRKAVLGVNILMLYAGIVSPSPYTADGFPATSTGFSNGARQKMAFDADGNMFFSNEYNSPYIRLVRRTTGIVSTVAGKANGGGSDEGYSGDGGPATSAKFEGISSMQAIGPDVYLTENGNYVIRKLSCTFVAPTMSPTRVPTVTPSSIPTVTPSRTPTATPSRVPSASPSAVPTMTPSRVPTVVPSATPSVVPSATPSQEPTATPSSEPSVEPSASPSQEPSTEPTQSPSEVPSSSPTMTPLDITFDVSLCVHNLTSAEHYATCQDVVCSALEWTLGLQESGVWFKNQLAVEATQLKTVVGVEASTGDFSETGQDGTGEVLYAKLVALLETAVESDVFTETVRSMSADFNTSCFVHVTNVTLEVSPFIVVVPSDGSDADDGLSGGALAGVIVGSVVGGLLLLCLLCCAAKPKGHKVVAHAEASTDDSHGKQANDIAADVEMAQASVAVDSYVDAHVV